MQLPERLIDGFIEVEHIDGFVISQRMRLRVSPHGFDRVELGSVGRQIFDLEPLGGVGRQPPLGGTVNLPAIPDQGERPAQLTTCTCN